MFDGDRGIRLGLWRIHGLITLRGSVLRWSGLRVFVAV